MPRLSFLLLALLCALPAVLASDGHDHDDDHGDGEDEIHIEMTLAGEVADFTLTEVEAIQSAFVTLCGDDIESSDKVTVELAAGSAGVDLEIHIMVEAAHVEHVEEAVEGAIETQALADAFIKTAVPSASVVGDPTIEHLVGGHDDHDDHDDHDHEAGSGAPPPPPDPCFPSSAMVTLADGTPTRIDSLKEGDAIIAADADGRLTSGMVSPLSLAKPNAKATFVTLTTTDGKSLSLTDGHHVPFGGACCSMVKKAKDIVVGDTIWTVTDGAASAQAVTAKAHANLTGLHSPVLTNGGYPIVDGVATSFDDAQTVALAAKTLKYLLPLCKATGSCNLFRRTFLNADRQYIDEA